MDKAIFQFDSRYYTNDVSKFNRTTCERLAYIDKECVTKFDLEGESLEELLNNDRFDTTNCFFKVFM